jgi:hypothetical protein
LYKDSIALRKLLSVPRGIGPSDPPASAPFDGILADRLICFLYPAPNLTLALAIDWKKQNKIPKPAKSPQPSEDLQYPAIEAPKVLQLSPLQHRRQRQEKVSKYQQVET